MLKLMRAIKAEMRKLWSKGSLLGCFVLVFALAFGASFLCSIIKSTGIEHDGLLVSQHAQAAFAAPQNEGWREKTRAVVEECEKGIKEKALQLPETSGPEKAVLEREMAQLIRDQAVAQHRLDNNLTVWDWSGSLSLILCLWLMTPVVAIVTLIYVSDIFAGEFSRGTVRVILSRPVTRFKLFAAKMITALILGALFMLVAYAASGIGCGVLMEPANGMYVGYVNGSAYSSSWNKHVFMVFLCCCASVAMCVALCAALGNLTRSRGVAGVCTAALALGANYAGPLAGMIDSDIVGLALPFCYDLTVPLCGVAYSSGCSFVTCALSVAVHFLVFAYIGYASLRRDV